MTLRIDAGHRPARRRVNLTPIMDVVFILVIFFLLAAQFSHEAGQRMTLAPDRDADVATIAEDPPARLAVGAAGFDLDGTQTDAAGLAAALSALDGKALLIETAADAPYQALVTALDAARSAGIVQVRVTPAAPASGEGGQ